MKRCFDFHFVFGKYEHAFVSWI